MTTSLPTRPKIGVRASTSCISLGVRAAKSAWPPSDAPDVVKHRFTQAGARGDDRGVASWRRDALLQHRELARLERRHRVRERLEIVDDDRLSQASRLRDLFALNEPGNVRETRHLIGNRAGDAEAGGGDRARLHVARAEELAHHLLEPAVLERDELADLHRLRPLGCGREQAEERFRSADVACEKHEECYQLSALGCQLSAESLLNADSRWLTALKLLDFTSHLSHLRT